jgi:hypothetical protein
MRLGNRAADRQTNANAVAFGRVEGLKQAAEIPAFR